MRKWAYEIHSCFLVPRSPLELQNIDPKVTIYLSYMYLIYLSILYSLYHPSIYLSTVIFIYLSFSLSDLSIYLSIYISIYHLSIYLSICLSIYPSIVSTIHLHIYLPLYWSICISVCRIICLSVLHLYLFVLLSTSLPRAYTGGVKGVLPPIHVKGFTMNPLFLINIFKDFKCQHLFLPFIAMFILSICLLRFHYLQTRSELELLYCWYRDQCLI